jgi:FixJ family two-component response regulator
MNSPTTVIVVDDDRSIRRALKTQLESLGFKVLLFQSAEELLGYELPVDTSCLLVDIYLPGMTGIDLCRELETSGRRRPTVLMSGRDDSRTREMIRDAKPIANLQKPFEEKSLLRAIRKALRSETNPR